MAFYEIKNVIHPKKVLPSIKEYLIPRYIKDYGIENKDKIIKRFNDTIFIFDSNPIETREFMVEHLDEIKDIQFKVRTEIEYRDYLRVKEFVHSQSREAFDIALIENKYVQSYADLSDLWDLDFESYSYDVFENCTDNQELDERRTKYENDCFIKGMNPIKDFATIEKILFMKNVLKQLEKEEMIKRTIWGKRIKREIKKDYSFSIPNDQLSEILFDHKDCALTGVCKDKENQSKCFIYFPIIRNRDFPSLDHIFFHEARHRVENEDDYGGLYYYDKPDYYYINELHTEWNALLDEDEKNNIYFGGGDSQSISLYQYLFKVAEDFFEYHREILNEFAFVGNIKGLEECFGKDFLKELECNLSKEGEVKFYKDHKEKVLR